MEKQINAIVLIEKLYKSASWDFSYDLETIKSVFTHVDEGVKKMYGGALIMIAALYQSKDLVTCLGIDINACNTTQDSATALIIAAGNNNIQAAQFLLDHGADVNYKNVHQYTALHFAAFRGSLEVVQALLAAGAFPNIKDKNSYSPLDCALTGFFQIIKESAFSLRRPIYIDIVTSLMAAGANPADLDKNGRTVMDELLESESQITDLLDGTNLSMLSRPKKDLLCGNMKETIKMIQQFKEVLQPANL